MLDRTHALEQAIRELRAEMAERNRAAEWFGLIIDTSPGALIVADLQGHIVLVNAQAEATFGYSRDELFGQDIGILTPERFRADGKVFLKPELKRRMGGGRHLFGRRKDSSEFPIDLGLNSIQTPKGVFVLSAIVDITEQEAAEDRNRSLIDELDHRVKNTLAIVRSLINSSITSNQSPAEALKMFAGRFEALANSQELLSANRWRGTDIRLICKGNLPPNRSVLTPCILMGHR